MNKDYISEEVESVIKVFTTWVDSTIMLVSDKDDSEENNKLYAFKNESSFVRKHICWYYLGSADYLARSLSEVEHIKAVLLCITLHKDRLNISGKEYDEVTSAWGDNKQFESEYKFELESMVAGGNDCNNWIGKGEKYSAPGKMFKLLDGWRELESVSKGKPKVTKKVPAKEPPVKKPPQVTKKPDKSTVKITPTKTKKAVPHKSDKARSNTNSAFTISLIFFGVVAFVVYLVIVIVADMGTKTNYTSKQQTKTNYARDTRVFIYKDKGIDKYYHRYTCTMGTARLSINREDAIKKGYTACPDFEGPFKTIKKGKDINYESIGYTSQASQDNRYYELDKKNGFKDLYFGAGIDYVIRNLHSPDQKYKDGEFYRIQYKRDNIDFSSTKTFTLKKYLTIGAFTFNTLILDFIGDKLFRISIREPKNEEKIFDALVAKYGEPTEENFPSDNSTFFSWKGKDVLMYVDNSGENASRNSWKVLEIMNVEFYKEYRLWKEEDVKRAADDL